MDPILIGIAALGVAVLGLLGHAWQIVTTRSATFAMLWVMVPLAGAAIAFLTATPNLQTISLGGAALVLAVITLVTPLVAPVILEPAKVERDERSQDRAA